MKNLDVPSPQAVELPNSKVPGRSGIWRNVLSVDSLTKSHLPNSISTGFEAFEVGHSLSKDLPCLGHRNQDPVTGKWGPYEWETYAEIRKRRDDFGAGLVRLYRGLLKGTKNSQFCVGIQSINRVEWSLTDLACQAYSLISVALYDTLGPDAVSYIINLSEIEIIVAELEHIPKLLSIKDKIPGLKLIISMDSLREPNGKKGRSKFDILGEWGKSKGVTITDFSSVEASGRSAPLPYVIPNPSDIFTINYTSGTTGNPKGVVLTQGNAATAAHGPLTTLLPHSGPSQEEVVLSFLPLAHIYERLNFLGAFMRGCSIGFFHGNILEILDDIQTLRPTLLAAVPRLLLRIENAIKASTIKAPGLRGALSRRALAEKLAQMDAGGNQYHWLWDRLWSKKINQVLGGRLQLIISGSAPLSKDTCRFLKAALACEVIEGWGMTETVAAGTVAHPGDKVVGHVGPPIAHSEVTLQDVPTMGYFSTDKPYPRGELLVRGGMRLREYYKEKEKTDEAITPDGWLRTGDVAMIDTEGRIYIIDRVKNIFKLSQGEYVAAERLEAMYACCPLVAQIFVHGDSFQCYLVSVIGVDPISFSSLATTVLGTPVSPNDSAALAKACADKRMRSIVIEELGKVAQEKGLAGFEKIKNVHLAIEPFTIDNECLTPSFKLKRVQALQRYKKDVEKLYAEGEAFLQKNAKL